MSETILFILACLMTYSLYLIIPVLGLFMSLSLPLLAIDLWGVEKSSE